MNIFSSLHQWSDLGLLALRLALAAIFWVHGMSKRAMWRMQPNPQMPAPLISLLRTLSIAEPLSAVAMLFGLLTPLAAIGQGLVMLGAIRMKTSVWKTPFMAQDKTGWEIDLLVLAADIALLVLGAGMYSLDRLWLGM